MLWARPCSRAEERPRVSKPGPCPLPHSGYKPADHSTFSVLDGIGAWASCREGSSTAGWEGWGRLPQSKEFVLGPGFKPHPEV